jgi:hypothetical protein
VGTSGRWRRSLSARFDEVHRGPYPLALIPLLIASCLTAGLLGLWAARWWAPARCSVTWWLLVLLVIIAAAAAIWLKFLATRRDEAARGISVAALATAAGAAAIAAIWKPAEERAGVQFVVLVVLFGAALIGAATEWSRRWLALLLGATAVGLVAMNTTVGYRTVAEERVIDPIEAAVEEREELGVDADDSLSEAQQKYETSIGSARSALETAVNDLAPSPVRTAGEELLERLADSDRQSYLEDFLAQSAQLEPRNAGLVLVARAKARAAVEAFAATPKAPPSAAELDTAISSACKETSARGLAPKGCPVPPAPVTTIATDDEAGSSADRGDGGIGAALRELSIELAKYRFAVTGDDADKAARDAALEEDSVDLDVSFLDAMSAGPSRLIKSGDSHPLNLVPGPLGWAILGFLAIWAVRALLDVNARQVAGPVKVEYTGDDVGHLETAVLSNIDAPGTAPGSVMAQSITDIAAITTPATAVQKVIDVVVDLLAPSQGFIVRATSVPPTTAADEASTKTEGGGSPEKSRTSSTTTTSRPGDARCTVLIRITRAATGATVAAKTFDDEDPATALRLGGFWAAGTLLSRSTRIPTWAAWTDETGAALATATSQRPSLDELREAVSTAPDSGILLLSLAYELELDGRPLEGLLYLARCVEAHPRYVISRYRLGVAVGMIGRDVAETWAKASLSEQTTLRDALTRACVRIGLDPGVVVVDERQSSWYGVARNILESSIKDLSWPRSLVAALRRSDRDVVFRRSRIGSSRPHRRWRFRALARSAQLVYADSPSEDVRRVVAKDLDDPRRTWQLHYNAACRLAGTNAPAALVFLERCLALEGSGQLSRQWAQTDPDLKPLHGHPRFTAFLEQLRSTDP